MNRELLRRFVARRRREEFRKYRHHWKKGEFSEEDFKASYQTFGRHEAFEEVVIWLKKHCRPAKSHVIKQGRKKT